MININKRSRQNVRVCELFEYFFLFLLLFINKDAGVCELFKYFSPLVIFYVSMLDKVNKTIE